MYTLGWHGVSVSGLREVECEASAVGRISCLLHAVVIISCCVWYHGVSCDLLVPAPTTITTAPTTVMPTTAGLTEEPSLEGSRAAVLYVPFALHCLCVYLYSDVTPYSLTYYTGFAELFTLMPLIFALSRS